MSAFSNLSPAQKALAIQKLQEAARKARITADMAVGDLRKVEEELRRRQWSGNAEAWCRDKLHDQLWSGQVRILRSVQQYRRTAAKTCHEVGKSYIAGRIAAWWIDTHKAGEAFVVTTAPTAPQVKVILWKEIGRAHTQGALKGRVNQTEWLIDVDGKEEIVAFGRKPSDYSPAAFQGIHAPYVLVIVDEANGVSGLWEAIDSVIANDESKILAIGNPDVPVGEFYEACKPGSGWNVVQISAFDSPNFTGEKLPQNILRQLIGQTYVEEKRRKWAPGWKWTPDGKKCIPPVNGKPEDTNPFWQSKVLGEFPTLQGDGSLIPLPWIRSAQERTLDPKGAIALGCDVGGGGDSSCIALRTGPVVRILREDTNPDTMQTCGNILAALVETGAAIARVDSVGIGRGVVDRAREARSAVVDNRQRVLGVNVGEKADDPEQFANLRAELWWNVREMFEQGEIDIDQQDDDLAAELASLRFERTSRGQVKIESKDDAKRRGVPSPNRADALMLACAGTHRITDTSKYIAETPPPAFRIPEATKVVSFADMNKMFGR